ncbi:hypothetical protein ACNKHM_11730 [Shigella sonnei]
MIDRHPGMIRVNEERRTVDVNLAITAGQFCRSVMSEPAGLAIGKIKLADGSEVLGVWQKTG